VSLGRWLATWALALLAAWGPQLACAEPVHLSGFELTRSDEGLLLSFATRFELSRAVDDAVQKGVPLIFVAEAQVYRKRWYWADKLVASATRSWRLAYQPLTRQYRVTFSGVTRSHDNLSDALAALSSASRWKLADKAQLDDDDSHYVEFSYRLDTTQMPRPLQISIVGQSDWQLRAEHTRRVK
jgi:hypothetical protein